MLGDVVSASAQLDFSGFLGMLYVMDGGGNGVNFENTTIWWTWNKIDMYFDEWPFGDGSDTAYVTDEDKLFRQ